MRCLRSADCRRAVRRRIERSGRRHVAPAQGEGHLGTDTDLRFGRRRRFHLLLAHCHALLHARAKAGKIAGDRHGAQEAIVEEGVVIQLAAAEAGAVGPRRRHHDAVVGLERRHELAGIAGRHHDHRRALAAIGVDHVLHHIGAQHGVAHDDAVGHAMGGEIDQAAGLGLGGGLVHGTGDVGNADMLGALVIIDRGTAPCWPFWKPNLGKKASARSWAGIVEHLGGRAGNGRGSRPRHQHHRPILETAYAGRRAAPRPVFGGR